MENDKPKMELYQKVLVTLSGIFLAVSIVFVMLRFMGILSNRYSSVALGLSMILNCCAYWKKNPIYNTIIIALCCIIIGVNFVLLILR